MYGLCHGATVATSEEATNLLSKLALMISGISGGLVSWKSTRSSSRGCGHADELGEAFTVWKQA